MIKLVDWIITNRRKNAFKEFPHNKIVAEIQQAIRHDVFVISHKKGVINGVACGEKNEDEKVIIIHDVLTTAPGVVKEFIIHCTKKYPDYMLVGLSHNRLRIIYKPKDFAKRIK